MTSPRKSPIARNSPTAADRFESLYLDLLRSFYGEGDRTKSRQVAAKLCKAMEDSPEFDDSIRAEEIRSLVAELRGDLAAAVQSREAEIRKILELHSLAINTPGWQRVLQIYDFSDISDRLDLLAILYDQAGDLDRAILTLRESKHFCDAHKISFDGHDLLDELECARGLPGHSNGDTDTPSKPRPNKRRSLIRDRRSAARRVRALQNLRRPSETLRRASAPRLQSSARWK